MSEYIRREDAIDKINERQRKLIYCFGFENDAVKIMDIAKSIIIAISAVDVVPVVHSQWKYKCGEIQCPECGNRIHRIDLSGCLNFCPNCGAKMDGKE